MMISTFGLCAFVWFAAKMSISSAWAPESITAAQRCRGLKVVRRTSVIVAPSLFAGVEGFALFQPDGNPLAHDRLGRRHGILGCRGDLPDRLRAVGRDGAVLNRAEAALVVGVERV